MSLNSSKNIPQNIGKLQYQPRSQVKTPIDLANSNIRLQKNIQKINSHNLKNSSSEHYGKKKGRQPPQTTVNRNVINNDLNNSTKNINESHDVLASSKASQINKKVTPKKISLPEMREER